MKLASNLLLRLAGTLLVVVTMSGTAALAGGGDNPGQDSGGTFGSAQGPSLVRTEQRTYERCRELPKLVGDKSFPDGAINYGEHGETQKKTTFPTIPGKVWPIVTMPYQPQGPEKMAAWCKVMDEITGYSKNPQIGEVNLSPAFCALALANQGQMLADTLQNPQENLSRVREEQNQQTQQAADNCAAMERQQAGCAIDFVASYLNNFTVDNSNKWNQVRNQLFLPMALLLLLPGAVLAQVKSIVSQGFPVLGEISPWEGIFRSVVAIFLIPATYLVVNYGIDLSNSITFSISDQYQKIFGTDMYEDAMCAHIRAFPFREPGENKNYVPDQEAKMSKLSSNNTPFAQLEGKMVDVKLTDPCAGINIVPPDRANEQVKYSVNAQRNAYNQANAALAMTWNILCAFQMAYLYYLWFVGPVVAALWVYPMKQLRDAFPSWCEGVLTLCFWSLFWNTVVLLMACFRGVDDTGTIIMTALNFLSTACVKFAFDFAGLVKDAGREAAKMAEKAASGGGGGKGAQGGNGAQNGHGAQSGGNGTTPNPPGGGAGSGSGTGAGGDGGQMTSGGLNGGGIGAGGEGLGGAMPGGNSSPLSGAVDMNGFPAPPTHGHSHFAAGLGTGLGIGLGSGALLAGAIELAHHHAHHNPASTPPSGGAHSGDGMAGAGGGAGAEGTRGANGGLVDAGGVDGPGTTFDVSHEGDLYDIDHDIDFGANSIAAANGDLSVSGSPSGPPPLSTGGVPVSLTPGDVSGMPSGGAMPPLAGGPAIDIPGVGAAGAGAAGAAAAGLVGNAVGDHGAVHSSGHGHGAGVHPVAHGPADAAHGGHGHSTGHADHIAHTGSHGHGAANHVAHVPGVSHPPADGHGHAGGAHGQPGHPDPNHIAVRDAMGAAQPGNAGSPPSAQQIANAHQQVEAIRDLYRDAAVQQQQYQAAYGTPASGNAGLSGVDAGSIASYGANSSSYTNNGFTNNSYADYTVTGSMTPTGTGGVTYGSGSNSFTADPGYLTASGNNSYDASAANFSELAKSVASDPVAGSIIEDNSPSNSMGNVSAYTDYSSVSTYGGSDYSSSTTSYDSSYSTSSSYDSSYSNYTSSSSYDNSSTDYPTYSSYDAVGNTPIVNAQLPAANADAYSSAASSSPPSASYSYPSADSAVAGASPYNAPSSSQDTAAQTNALQAAGYQAPAPDSSSISSYGNGNNAQQTDNWSQPNYANNAASNYAGDRAVSMNVDNSNTTYQNAYAPQVEHRANPDAPANQPTAGYIGAASGAQNAAGIAGAAAMFAAGINHNKMAADARKQAPMGQPVKQVKPGAGAGAGAPGGKQSRMGAALGRANTGNQPKPGAKQGPAGKTSGNQPARGLNASARKSVENPMDINSGSTLRRYRQARKMTPEELAELEKTARENGQDWMPC